MALTTTEEALLRDLLAKQAQLIALANNETTITAKLGSTKATIDDLTAATTVADADLMIVRQGGVDKKLPVSVIKSDPVDLSPYAPLASPALSGTPTAPTATPGTDDTQIATTAFVQAAQSAVLGQFGKLLSDNGYQKLPSGLIIQWGSGTCPPINGAAAIAPVTFPFAFTTKVYSIVGTFTSSFNTSGGGTWAVRPVDISLTSFIATGDNNASGYPVNRTVGFYWIAIGV